MEPSSEYKLKMKIEAAAHFEAERSLLSISQLLGYRQRVAQELLSFDVDDKEFDSLMVIFNDSEEKIKLALGL